MMIPTYAELAYALDALWASCQNDGDPVTPDDDDIARAEAVLDRVQRISTMNLPYYGANWGQT